MALPTTSSDPSADASAELAAWDRCLKACVGTLAIGLFVVFAFMILVDPYDSGRFGLLGIDGMADRNTTTATVSRARDPDFDSAIIGNSTAQLLDPVALSEATGLKFVQLRVNGASPSAELAVLDFFLRHHPGVRALAIITDPSWCAHDVAELLPDRFPFWLYEDSALGYAERMLSWPAVEHAFQRLAIGLSWRKRNDPTGTFRPDDIAPQGVFREINRPSDPRPAATAAFRDVFPEVARLDDIVKKLPADAGVVVVVPPTFARFVPQPGTVLAAEREACNSALQRIVAGRPHSNFINLRLDNALTRDPANFEDFIHYRPNIAAKVGAGIAASLRDGAAAKIEF
jgi:hypothetical protein